MTDHARLLPRSAAALLAAVLALATAAPARSEEATQPPKFTDSKRWVATADGTKEVVVTQEQAAKRAARRAKRKAERAEARARHAARVAASATDEAGHEAAKKAAEKSAEAAKAAEHAKAEAEKAAGAAK